VNKEAWGDLVSLPIVPDRYRDQPHLFPQLVELEQMDEHARMGLLDRARRWVENHGTPYFSALLQTSTSAERLRRHLANQMDRYHFARRQYDVIRLHDPKVFRHMRWLLDAHQWETLLGPIDSWAWLEPAGSWQRRDRDRDVTNIAAQIRLSPGQWISLLRVGEINQSLARLSRVAPEIPDDAKLAQQLDALLGEAWGTYQLEDRTDRLLFAEQAVRFHPRIHQHPQLQERLQRVHAPELTYAGACIDLDDAAMRRLANELKQPYKDYV
jgi:hypothetical protein